MKKLNIAILTGGNVAEREISLLSSQTILDNLDNTKYNCYLIDLSGKDFIETSSGVILDKNDFSLKINNLKITFDLIFLMLHGHPAEDGSIQGYFNLLGIPCTGCNHFSSALTFNKQACKSYLMPYNIDMAPSRLLRQGDKIKWEELGKMDLPLFVKPNKNGSSYGVSKVKNYKDLPKAVDLAFEYDDEIIIEGFLDGNEFSNGVFRHGKEVIVLPITEIVSKNEFFDYEAKYLNESEEITPARLSDKKTKECQAISKKLYEVLGCAGMTRFDYILMNDIFYFLEANTIPGFSPASIFPQQIQEYGWTISKCLDSIIKEALDQ
ncbi:MAG: D-alanine--D-alanine ligase [Bacteroidetes bacterium]|jgi:D-alanine-D-alanine ligase|nr:D-alanine--D-alanine ligase [Bacteroidota bacterium]MDF1863275.1 D-alanine--D-alanine ligase [Saprospiraceae bacterium]